MSEANEVIVVEENPEMYICINCCLNDSPVGRTTRMGRAQFMRHVRKHYNKGHTLHERTIQEMQRFSRSNPA